jgi:DNA modification methylase
MSTAEYINRIITGTNTEVLQDFDDGSIDLTVTSPPYDNLRTYKGFSFDFEGISEELYRVTKPGGVVVWVVGDATHKGSETLTSFKQALYFKEVGFNIHDTMIYKKHSVLPMFPTAQRYNHSFEYMFILSKGKPETFNAIEVPKIEGVVYGGDNIKTRLYGKEESRKTIRRRDKSTKLADNVWIYKTGNNQSTKDKIAFNHPAIFPEALAQDHIISWSNPGDIVLDTFGGSGTTAKMAKLNGRNFIHIDISEEYNEIARKRIEGVDVDGQR